MGCLPVLFVHVEACAVHGRDDFVEGDLTGGVEEAGEVYCGDRRPFTGSQVRPRLCSIAISAEYSIWSMLSL